MAAYRSPACSSGGARRCSSSSFGLLFPVAVAALPLYLLLRQLGLLESLLGVALPEAAFAIPITIIILRPFMRAIGGARGRGARWTAAGIGFFLLVLVPLSQPALVTVTILSVITSWNNFILPLLVLTDPSRWTSRSASPSTRASTVPTPLPFSRSRRCRWCRHCSSSLAAQRRIVGGLSGAVKG